MCIFISKIKHFTAIELKYHNCFRFISATVQNCKRVILKLLLNFKKLQNNCNFKISKDTFLQNIMK